MRTFIALITINLIDHYAPDMDIGRIGVVAIILAFLLLMAQDGRELFR